MSSRSLSRVEFPGPAGSIEGLLHRPAGVPRFAALASHPHPLFGGTMDNKVIYRVARGLEEAGGLVLRYNFRGAGRSQGEHDAGRGEQEDLSAALAFLRASGGKELPTLLAGFSFGAAMSVQAGVTDPSIDALLLVGAPAERHVFGALASFGRPVAFLHGEHDDLAPLLPVEELLARIPEPKVLRVIAGAGHFFDGQQDALQAAVVELVTSGALGPLAVHAA